ncbi:Protein cwh43 [Termitomyces sp. T112]|nr:Protein cwh43 [Termitomyces sp. T112]KAH0585002.1 hypothetical protein H2248_008273 [Termitomyces sp. 'cryptogamus']
MHPTSTKDPLLRSPNKPIVLNAALVARIHTYLAYTAFLTALVVACLCHYKKVVKNSIAGYPEEWFPSVSATIGDWYPERNIFQILIALTAGPRFGLVLFQYYLHYPRRPAVSTTVFIFGVIRTLSCGGWVYITSSDDHDVHDAFMITYMVCNLPWMLGSIACTPSGTSVRAKRIVVSSTFFVTIIPLVYFFIQHKVHRIPGAYTCYSFFEWGLIFFDILYDAITEQEYREADLQVFLGPKVLTVPNMPPVQGQPMESVTPDGVATEKITSPNVQDVNRNQTILNLFPLNLSGMRPALSFLSDVYLSYIFWSIFTSLIPTLFYFSVWELGLAGQELALLSTLSPVFLGIGPLSRWAQSRDGQTTLHLMECLGLLAFALGSPVLRLVAVASAAAVAVLRQVAKWSADEGREWLTVSLGCLVAALLKQFNHSNNPLWPFVDNKKIVYNAAGLALTFIAIYETHTRPTTISSTPAKEKAKVQSPSVPSWFTAALPLGSLLFTIHNLVSDPSTLIAWSWTGYQNGVPRGPVPHLHGALTLIAQCAGLFVPILLVPSNAVDLLTHPVWFIFGTLSTYIMYMYRNWTGYAGGLGLALFLMSITPIVLGRAVHAAKGGAIKVFGVAMGVYCLFNLASIFTVAYAFVPGGVYFRERTDCVLIAQMACLALAFRWSQVNSQPLLVEMIPSKMTLSFSRALVAVISILSVLGTLYRWPSSPSRPWKSGPRIFNAGIWTVHFGIDNEGRDSQQGITNLIRDMQLDVVGLLETDLHRTAFGHRDLTRVAIEQLGYYVDIGPGPNSHTWGASLLSKFPIINSTHHLLPSPHGELAPAIEAVLDIYGTKVTVVVAHNGQEEDPLDRELQSQEIARIMAASHPRPLVFLGYVVTKPHAERPAPYKFLAEDGKVHDIDEEDEDRWCEYIFYRGLYRTSYARISRGSITDTELQIGQFALPKHGTGVTNETRPARYLRSHKETLPEHHWFPMEYYGDENQGGVNGHFYHVFMTPLYYDLPENAVL